MASSPCGRGLLISLEGVEGSGKTTHLLGLKNYLKGKGYKVLALREPGGTSIGEKVRRVLLSQDNQGMFPLTELFLYLASRAQLVEEKIKPALSKGYIVLLDRFSDATFAYQGYGRGVEEETVKSLNNLATQGINPDLTIILDVGVSLGLERARGGGEAGDRMEREPLGFHRRVRRGYLALARREPQRIKIVRVRKSKDQTQDRVRELVDLLLEERAFSHGI